MARGPGSRGRAICATCVLGVAFAMPTVPLPGCGAAPPIAEPFARDRTGATGRALQNALASQESAGLGLLDALDRLRAEEIATLTPNAAYDRARRSLLRADSRIASASTTMGLADARVADLLEQWRAERRLYRDRALREDADARLATTRQAIDDAQRALRRSLETLAPVRAELADATLYLKHARDGGEVRPAPVSAEGAARHEAARAALREALAASRGAVEHVQVTLGRAPTRRTGG